MKKSITLSLVCAAIFSFSVNAQTWSGSTPGNIYYNSGNVGIGTTNPSYKLDIVNNDNLNIARFSSGQTDAAIILNNATTGGNQYAIVSSGTGSGIGIGSFSVYNMNMGNIPFLINHVGDVGIGTTVPIQKLHVEGSIAATAAVAVGNNKYFTFQRASDGYIGAQIGNVYENNGYKGSLAFEVNNGGGVNTVSEAMRINSNGNVGIGTSTPGSILSVSSNVPVFQLFSASGNPSDGSSMGKIAFGTAYGEFASMGASRVAGDADDVSYLTFKTSFGTGAGGDGINLERMRINPNGYIGIGTTTPDEKLAVNGSIHSQEVRVDLTGWEDKVFKRSYKLPSLTTVKAYTDLNHHLPDMPSESELIKSGLNVGNMEKILTKKVEELTLYMIEKDKQVSDLQKEIEQLKDQLNLIIKEVHKN